MTLYKINRMLPNQFKLFIIQEDSSYFGYMGI